VLNADPRTPFEPKTWLFLAMAYARLGQAEQAQRWLDRLEQWLEKHKAVLAGELQAIVPPSVDWEQWLEIQILHREAKAELQKARGSPSPS
jgi:hypothetical protein